MCVWLPDADGIEMNSNALNILFVNTRINNFLKRKSKSLGISGIKGQGKTFLIKMKRKMIQDGYQNKEDFSVACYPIDRMVSVLDRSLTIKESIYNYLEDFSVWINVWKLALMITLMQDPESKIYYKTINFNNMNRVEAILKDFFAMENRTLSITNVFSKLLQLNKKELNILVRNTNALLLYLDRINHSICFFIDKTDQAFSLDKYPPFGSTKVSTGPRNASFWQYAQFSLAIMSYDINNINNHIKVYYTLRNEALIDAEKLDQNSFRNVQSYIINLSYSKQELREMFELYVKAEDESLLKNPAALTNDASKAFFGFNEIKHQYVNKTEDIFDYIYRHSMKRPCDIMNICKEISNRLNYLDVYELRRVVNRTARVNLKNYLAEQKPFLSCDFEELLEVLVGVNTNVFTLNYMKNVCDRYNLFKNNIRRCTRNCSSCQSLQPFSILYNIGLLGYMKDQTNEMFFVSQGNSIIWLNTHSLTNHKLFFLHPCLTDFVALERKKRNLNFYHNNCLIVSDGDTITDSGIKKTVKNFKVYNNRMTDEKIFVSSTVDDLLIERGIVRDRIFELNKTPIMSEYEDFRYISNLRLHSHDVCIKEALSCKNLIFIVGKCYGGNYSGNNYKKIKEQIIQDSMEKITSPSISLMELYAFRNKKNKFYHIFVSKTIMNCLKDEIKRKEQGIDEKIVKEVNFLNHLANSDKKIQGNWFHVYTDIDDFKQRVYSLIFL